MSFDVQYFSFDPQRADERWNDFSDTLRKTIQQERSGVLGSPIGAVLWAAGESEILHGLKLVDLHYGSVLCEPLPDDGKIEYFVLEAVMRSAGLAIGNSVPPKEYWIQVFTGINEEFVKRATDVLVHTLRMSQIDHKEMVIEYLWNIRPLVKDLKENAGSMFVYLAESRNAVSPDSVETLLMRRAHEHVVKFREDISAAAIAVKNKTRKNS